MSDVNDLISNLDVNSLFSSGSNNTVKTENVKTSSDVESSQSVSDSPPVLKPRPVSRSVSPDDDKYSTIRKVPRRIMRYVQREFPDASNMTDALVAYLICHSPGELSERSRDVLTDDQKVLIQNWTGDPYTRLYEKMNDVLSKMKNVSSMVGVVEVLCSYLVFDRIGFRQENPVSPDLIDFNENGVLELLMHVEEQAKSMQQEKSIVNGRPIR